MQALLNSLLIMLLVSQSCNKVSLCTSLPCNEKNTSVKKFFDINFRKGIWVNTTNTTERTATQDTIEFFNDTIWSFWNISKYTPPNYYYRNHQKYLLFTNGNNVGTLHNYSNSHGQATTTHNTFDWLYDENKQILFIDFNRDFRFSNQPVVYSKFIKISE